MIRYFLKKDQHYSAPMEYIFSILSINKKITLSRVYEKNNAQIIVDHEDPNSIKVNAGLYESLLNKKQYGFEYYFQSGPMILFPESQMPDYPGTAFYLLNSFQEFGQGNDKNAVDNFGRFRYEKSYQHKFDCIESNIVQECLDNFCAENPVLRKTEIKKRKTKVFLSHDIDSIHGSFFQDGLWALKKGRIDVLFKLVFNEIIRRPGWKNLDEIAKLHSDHNLKSTFFWLATNKTGPNQVKNADYNIEKLGDIFKTTSSNGLHKSCFPYSFEEELKLLPFKTDLNRYHFLKFALPSARQDLEKSKIKMDASLGFAERYGFRNNYGLPFTPYNIETNSPHNFVEVPLNLMDGTFQKYMRIPKEQTAEKIIDFIERNKENCVLSILWHNTFFTEYKYAGYLEEYRKILLYLKENSVESITPEEIISEFAHGKEN